MGLLLRRRTGLALLPVLLVLTALLAGCDSGEGPEPSAESSAPSPSATATADADDGATATDQPLDVERLCAPYHALVDALQSLDYGADPDRLATELAPVVKRFAADVRGSDRPTGMSERAWTGVLVLAERILRLPDHPTFEDIEAVEQSLTRRQQAQVAAAAAWLKRTCA